MHFDRPVGEQPRLQRMGGQSAELWYLLSLLKGQEGGVLNKPFVLFCSDGYVSPTVKTQAPTNKPALQAMPSMQPSVQPTTLMQTTNQPTQMQEVSDVPTGILKEKKKINKKQEHLIHLHILPIINQDKLRKASKHPIQQRDLPRLQQQVGWEFQLHPPEARAPRRLLVAPVRDTNTWMNSAKRSQLVWCS